MFECTLLCKGRYLCASARMCVELSRDQHTCGWVFITAGLSDGLDRGRPLFIVISIHLISPRFTGQRRPPKTPARVGESAHMHVVKIEVCTWYGARRQTNVHVTLSSNHLRIIVGPIRLALAGPCFSLIHWNYSLVLVQEQRCGTKSLCFWLSLQEIRSWPVTGNAGSRPHLAWWNDTELRCKKIFRETFFFSPPPPILRQLILWGRAFLCVCEHVFLCAPLCVLDLSYLLNDTAIPHLGPGSTWPPAMREETAWKWYSSSGGGGEEGGGKVCSMFFEGGGC